VTSTQAFTLVLSQETGEVKELAVEPVPKEIIPTFI